VSQALTRRALGRVLPFTVVGADDVEHVKNDGRISDEQRAAKDGDAAHEFTDLHGQQQSAGDQSQPLGPGESLPQAIGFGEAQGGVGEGDAGRSPQARVGDAVGKVEKELRGTAIGIDVQPDEKTLGVQPEIFVDEGDGAQSHQHHEDALAEFERGYGPEHTPLAAVGIWHGSGLGHVGGGDSDAGYHGRDGT
jgi:hypothetical protein